MREVIVLKNKKLMKLAGSYVMVVNKQYINNGEIDVKERYNVALTKA